MRRRRQPVHVTDRVRRRQRRARHLPELTRDEASLPSCARLREVHMVAVRSSAERRAERALLLACRLPDRGFGARLVLLEPLHERRPSARVPVQRLPPAAARIPETRLPPPRPVLRLRPVVV